MINVIVSEIIKRYRNVVHGLGIVAVVTYITYVKVGRGSIYMYEYMRLIREEVDKGLLKNRAVLL